MRPMWALTSYSSKNSEAAVILSVLHWVSAASLSSPSWSIRRADAAAQWEIQGYADRYVNHRLDFMQGQ